uniref:Uncharacterized protein n=1 Tax=Lactuca sativa TaxID=4236 RepID=A0A9R1V899_LACSA|nr:hypothetical protein LSAT_V11C600335730 [Lactuca sativa]
MSNTRSRRSAFESDISSIRVIICKIHRLYKTLMYEAGGDPQVYKTACIDMFEGMGTENLKANLFIRTCALHNNIEAMFRHGIVCVDPLILPTHSVKGALAIGHEEDEDRQRYCTVFRWYVEYGWFCIFLKNING